MANNLYVYKGEIDGDGSITGIAIDWADSVEELCAVAWGVLDYTTVDGKNSAERCVSITDSGYLIKASDGTFTCECPFQSDIKSWEIFIWKKNTELSERDLEEEWKEDNVIPVEGIISDIVSIKDRLHEDEVSMNRALRAPEEGGDELIIPPVDVRSGHILGFNSKGQPTIGEDCEAIADFTQAASNVKSLVSEAETAATEAKASATAAETAKAATEDAAKSAVETIASMTNDGVEKMEALVEQSAENASTAESAATSAAESARKAASAAAGDVDLSDYVDITTDQKIDGVKSFTGLAAFAQDEDNEASYARWTIKPETEDGALRFTSEGGSENHFYLKPSSDMEDGDEATIALDTDVAKLDARLETEVARLDAKIDEVEKETPDIDTSELVHIAGEETITGAKTFNAGIVVSPEDADSAQSVTISASNNTLRFDFSGGTTAVLNAGNGTIQTERAGTSGNYAVVDSDNTFTAANTFNGNIVVGNDLLNIYSYAIDVYAGRQKVYFTEEKDSSINISCEIGSNIAHNTTATRIATIAGSESGSNEIYALVGISASVSSGEQKDVFNKIYAGYGTGICDYGSGTDANTGATADATCHNDIIAEGGYNYIKASSYNKLDGSRNEITGGYNEISASGNSGYNKIAASGAAGYNEITAGYYNKIIAESSYNEISGAYFTLSGTSSSSSVTNSVTAAGRITIHSDNEIILSNSDYTVNLTSIATAQDDIKTLSSSLTTLQSAVDTINSAIEALDGRITALENYVYGN